MRKSTKLSTVALAGMLALGIAFLPACSSEPASEPSAEEEAQEQEASEEEQAAEEPEPEAAPEAEPEALGAWVVTSVSGTNIAGDEYTVTNELDEHGNVTRSDSTSGVVTTSEYDEYGNVTHEVAVFDDGFTYDTTHEYALDENGRPVSDHYVEVCESSDYPSTTTCDVRFEYHANGMLKTWTNDMVYVTSIEGEEETFAYHYVTEYDEQGYEVLYRCEYDGGSSERTTVWEFDEAGNPVKAVNTTTDEDGTNELTSTFECDENGNVISRTDENIMTRYNENHEVEGTEVTSSTKTFEFAYVEDCSRAAYDSAQLVNAG